MLSRNKKKVANRIGLKRNDCGKNKIIFGVYSIKYSPFDIFFDIYIYTYIYS